MSYTKNALSIRTSNYDSTIAEVHLMRGRKITKRKVVRKAGNQRLHRRGVTNIIPLALVAAQIRLAHLALTIRPRLQDQVIAQGLSARRRRIGRRNLGRRCRRSLQNPTAQI